MVYGPVDLTHYHQIMPWIAYSYTQYHKILNWSKFKDLADDISKWVFIAK